MWLTTNSPSMEMTVDKERASHRIVKTIEI